MNAFVIKSEKMPECYPHFEIKRMNKVSNYNLTVKGCGSEIEIEKKASAFHVIYDGQKTVHNILPFNNGENSGNKMTVLDASEKYGPKFRPLIKYRERLNYFVILIFAIYILTYLALNKFKSKQFKFLGNLIMIFGWISLNYWIQFIYFTR